MRFPISFHQSLARWPQSKLAQLSEPLSLHGKTVPGTWWGIKRDHKRSKALGHRSCGLRAPSRPSAPRPWAQLTKDVGRHQAGGAQQTEDPQGRDHCCGPFGDEGVEATARPRLWPGSLYSAPLAPHPRALREAVFSLPVTRGSSTCVCSL